KVKLLGAGANHARRRADLTQESTYQHPVKLRAAERFNLRQSVGNGTPRGIGTINRHVHERLADGDDARAQRNIFSPQAVGIASTIDALVMMAHKTDGACTTRNCLQNLRSQTR